MQRAPFAHIAQFNAAKKLVIMPHSSFNRLAAEVGDPSGRKVTFVNMTARCGSTLLSQIMSRTPNTRSISELRAIEHLHRHLNCKIISMAEYRRLIRSVVQLMCKEEHGKDVKRIFIKTTPLMAPAFPTLKEMFPDFKFIFNTRNYRTSFESMMQLGSGLPLISHIVGQFSLVRQGDSDPLSRWLYFVQCCPPSELAPYVLP